MCSLSQIKHPEFFTSLSSSYKAQKEMGCTDYLSSIGCSLRDLAGSTTSPDNGCGYGARGRATCEEIHVIIVTNQAKSQNSSLTKYQQIICISLTPTSLGLRYPRRGLCRDSRSKRAYRVEGTTRNDHQNPNSVEFIGN